MNFLKKIIHYSFYFYNIKKLNSDERVFLLFFILTIPFGIIAFKDNFKILENPTKVFKLICLEQYERIIFKDTYERYYIRYHDEFKEYLRNTELSLSESEREYPIYLYNFKGISVEYKGEDINLVHAAHFCNFLREKNYIDDNYSKDLYFLIRFPFHGVNPLYFCRYKSENPYRMTYWIPREVYKYINGQIARETATASNKLDGFVEYEFERSDGNYIRKKYDISESQSLPFSSTINNYLPNPLSWYFYPRQQEIFYKNHFSMLSSEKKRKCISLPWSSSELGYLRFNLAGVNFDYSGEYVNLWKTDHKRSMFMGSDEQFAMASFYYPYSRLKLETKFIYTDEMKNKMTSYSKPNSTFGGSKSFFRQDHSHRVLDIFEMSLGSHTYNSEFFNKSVRYLVEKQIWVEHPFPVYSPPKLYESYRLNYPDLEEKFDWVDNQIIQWDKKESTLSLIPNTFYWFYAKCFTESVVWPALLLIFYLTIFPWLLYLLTKGILLGIFKPLWNFVYDFIKDGTKGN